MSQVRRAAGIVTALALAASLTARAEPPRPPEEGPPPQAEPREDADDGASKAWSLGGLGGVYGALSIWAYFAWYHNIPGRDFGINDDGWFGTDTYAGGADKLGHFWSNYTISRIGSEILMRGGWERLPASLISSSLSFTFFAAVEVKDGLHDYGFSIGDFVGNTAGAALSVLMVNVPEVDRWIDVRLEYMPSSAYLDGLTSEGDLDIAEDYSGQTYQLAFHLKAVPGLWRGFDYVDLVGGFKTRNFKPEPLDAEAIPSQHLFFGVSLNMQALLAEAFGEAGGGWRRAGHLAFEFYSPPYTTLPAAEAVRTAR